MTAPITPITTTPAAFVVGSVVKLASGGPAMTVSAIDATTGKITCMWYDGAALQTASQLDPAVLKAADAPVQVTMVSASVRVP